MAAVDPCLRKTPKWRGALRHFARDESGAISSLYAVGILVLVAMAGIGFDYGRIMALDTELQNAADQAALAAATQLDGSADAITNAQTAAANALGNQTRLANDGKGRAIPTSDLQFEYFEGYESDAFVGPTTVPEDATVVQVTVKPRVARYALTPLVGAFAGQAIGKAAAMLQAATCNVPPMMFCVPSGDTDFPTADDVGRGLKLHFKANGNASPGNPNDTTTDTTAWAPGNFGFLDLAYTSNKGQNSTTGLNSDAFGCTGEPPTSDPGFRTPQGSALNSRFDLYPPPTKKCDSTTGDFCPSQNVRKNLVLKMASNGGGNGGGNGNGNGGNGGGNGGGGGGNSCTAPNNISSNDWVDAASVGITDPGYPSDTAFDGILGNGEYSTTSGVPDLDGNGKISRYEVYEWELGDPASRLVPKAYTGSDGNKYCSFPRPVDQPPGVAASATSKDRRVMTVAAVDCSGLNGKAQVKILRWVDLFLLRPVDTTANDRNFLTEIIGPGKKPNGDSGFQYYGRRKAVLIR